MIIEWTRQTYRYSARDRERERHIERQIHKARVRKRHRQRETDRHKARVTVRER